MHPDISVEKPQDSKTQQLRGVFDKKDRTLPVRKAGLDVLRSCAISLVLLSHVLILLHFQYPVIGWAVMSGHFGVELFFVLSGSHRRYID